MGEDHHMTTTFNCQILRAPMCAILNGASNSGKTEFLLKLLLNRKTYFDVKYERIYYLYSSWQSKFDIMKREIPEIVFRQGLTFDADVDSVPNKHVLIVADDLNE